MVFTMQLTLTLSLREVLLILAVQRDVMSCCCWFSMYPSLADGNGIRKAHGEGWASPHHCGVSSALYKCQVCLTLSRFQAGQQVAVTAAF